MSLAGFFDRLAAYCVPEAGTNYKRRKNLISNSCEFAGDELRRDLARSRRISFALFAFRDFFPIDGDIAGRLDADAHLRTVHRHHGHFHIIANAQSLTGAASEYQHVMAPGNLTNRRVINS
jgi:hypothetical protein